MPLSQAPLDCPLVVHGYCGDGPFVERFQELGLTQGTELVVRRRAPLGGGIEVEFRGVRVGLRLHETAMILVRTATDECCTGHC